MCVQQSRDGLLNSLNETVQFIIASCRAFDSGFESEAKRIAVAVRVLVHDTPRLNPHGWHYVVGGKEINFANRPVISTLRHIAYEILFTLKDAFPG